MARDMNASERMASQMKKVRAAREKQVVAERDTSLKARVQISLYDYEHHVYPAHRYEELRELCQKRLNQIIEDNELFREREVEQIKKCLREVGRSD